MRVVWPSEAAVEEALGRDLRPGDARLVDISWPVFFPESATDPIEARLALRAACAAEGGTSRGHLSAVARFVAQAQQAGLTAADLRGAPGPLPRILARLPRPDPPSRPATATSADDICFRPRLTWQPAEVDAVLAVARRARVTVELYWGPSRPAIFEGMEQVVRAFEARPDVEGLELRFLDFEDGLAGALWRGTLPPPRPGQERPVEIVEAPTPDAELRAVAARIRRLVDSGVPPEEIAVVPCAARARRLDEELRRTGLLLDDQRGAPVLSSPAARLVLDLALLAERRFAREDVLAILGSRYVDFPEVDKLRREARARGARRLPLAPLESLPPEGSMADHATALLAAITRLHIDERARVGLDDDDDDDDGAEIAAAAARDHDAIERVEAALSGFAGRNERVTRAAFAAALADVLAELTLPPRRRRGGAVELVALEGLAGRSFEHLFLLGMTEAPSATDGVYGDRERRALNQHLRRRAFPDDEERTPFANLLLVHAVACARTAVVLSYSATDGERGLERHAFIDEVLRAVPWLAPTPTPRSPIWPLTETASARDVLERVALDRWADPRGLLPPARPRLHPADLEAADARLGDRLARVDALAAIERHRWRYFAGDEAANEWVGVVPGRPAGTAAAPLTPRNLELLANCPWTFLASRVLGVEPREEMDESAPPQTVGAIAHRILEVFYRRRAEAGALPVQGNDDDRQVLVATCATVFAQEGPRGHAGLWEVLQEKLIDDVWRLVTHAPSWGGRPEAFELSFGPLAIGDVWVKGRIDRVDLTVDGPVVVDYKLGALGTQKAKLRDETKLQLPIYAAAAQSTYGGRGDAAYASIRDGAYTAAIRPPATLPQILGALAGRVREGMLETAPVDCRGCHYRTACRVVTLAERDEG